MAVFSVGGNVGFALGPLVGSSLVVALGLSGGLLLVVPGLVVAIILLAEATYLGTFAPAPGGAGFGPREGDQPRAFTLLLVIVGLRSIAHYGLFTFVPLFEVAKGESEAFGTRLLSLFLFAGAVGTLVGGPLADRFGRKPVIVATLGLAAPLIVVYVLAGGVGGDVALVLSGGLVISTFGVTVVMSQEYLPSRIATASGLSIGLAIGLGGIFAVSLGAVADSVGLRTAMLATAVGPALAALLALALPKAQRVPLIEPVPASTS
jgi:FSR family fosmidomycin resistance protein-like MFS transporter